MKQTRELFYRFHKELNRPFESPLQLMLHALGLMSGHLKLDRLCFFAWDPEESLLSMRLAWKSGLCMEMEEDIEVGDSSALRGVIEERKIHSSVSAGRRAVYVSLHWGGGAASGHDAKKSKSEQIGVLRLERSGGSRPFTLRERQTALGLAEELSQNLYQAELDQSNREQLGRVTALTELTGIFASSLRVRDGLRLIIQGIQQYFGFDRVRLYMVDKQAQKLKGELSSDIRGQVRSLAYEEIPLQPGSHRFADILLGKSPDSFMDKYRDSVLYLPLTVQGAATGLLIVDNLLSQQPIVHSDLTLLKSFAGQIALAVDNARLFDEVQELSRYDELTRLPLRRYFTERLQEEFYRAERFRQPMALIWIDVDYFKEVNDTYGHQIGDKVLREIGRVVLGNLRKIDFPCRYGGDEILVLLPQSRAEDAGRIAARLSAETREIRVPVPFARAGEVRVSVSQGIATFPGDSASVEELLQKADEALYWVKSHGKGGVGIYSEVLGKDGRSRRPDENIPAGGADEVLPAQDAEY